MLDIDVSFALISKAKATLPAEYDTAAYSTVYHLQGDSVVAKTHNKVTYELVHMMTLYPVGKGVGNQMANIKKGKVTINIIS